MMQDRIGGGHPELLGREDVVRGFVAGGCLGICHPDADDPRSRDAAATRVCHHTKPP
jgi:hypothetical protein